MDRGAIWTLVLLSLVLAAIGGVYGYAAWREAEEWAEVDRALGRLEAGMEHETKIALRTTIANTAAAIELYVKRGSAQRMNDPRVVAGQKAIRSLEQGLDDRGRSYDLEWEPKDWPLMLRGLGKDLVTVECRGKQPFVRESSIRRAQLQAARRWLYAARHNGKFLLDLGPPVDPAAETKRCQAERDKKAQEARAKDDAARREHLARWKLHLDLTATGPPGNSVLVEYYVDGSGDGFEEFVEVGKRLHLDGHREIEIRTRDPEELNFSLNGAPFDPTWTKEPPGAFDRLQSITTVKLREK